MQDTQTAAPAGRTHTSAEQLHTSHACISARIAPTAVLGILGVHTLGFFVDSAMAMIHIDRALILLLIAAALNMGIDAGSRGLRARLLLPGGPPC